MALETVAAHTASRAGRASAARAFGRPATERCSISTPRWTVRRVQCDRGQRDATLTLLLRVDVAQEF
jgi:hypothetical protein|eukprot:COSAG06_NODE_13680_length_1232_cov_1.187996_1_plen_67_part_00